MKTLVTRLEQTPILDDRLTDSRLIEIAATTTLTLILLLLPLDCNEDSNVYSE